MGLLNKAFIALTALFFVVVGAIDYEKYDNVNVAYGPRDEQEIRFDRDNRGIRLLPGLFLIIFDYYYFEIKWNILEINRTSCGV